MPKGPRPKGASDSVSHPFQSLRHRNFRLFISGQLVSMVGTWIQLFAQSWLVYQITGSATALGLIAFASQAPILLLSSVTGVIVERLDTRRLLLATQTLSLLLALGLGSLVVLHTVQFWHVLVAAIGLGLVNAFDYPARQVLVAGLVPKNDLMNAIALNSTLISGARVVGPAIGGFLVAMLGEGGCFMLNALSYAGVIWALTLIPGLPRNHTNAHQNNALHEAGEGFGFVARNLPIRHMLLLSGCLSLLGTAYTVLGPIYADHVLRGGPRTFGLLLSAAGTGALAAAFTLIMRRSTHGLPTWVAGASLLFGAALTGFARSHNLQLSLVFLVLVGFGFMIQMTSVNTLIQERAPDHFRGRIMSIYALMNLGMVPIGGLLVGYLAKLLGPISTMTLAGTLSSIAGLAYMVNLPRWPKLASP